MAVVFDILIVDDEWVERDGIRMMLEQGGYPLRPHEAQNGEEALSILASRPIDIMITDIRMPFMDGITLALRARPQYAALKIVFYSAYGDFEYARQAIEAKASGYLLKPMTREALAKQMDALLCELRAERQLLPVNEAQRLQEAFAVFRDALLSGEYAQAERLRAALCALPFPANAAVLRYLALSVARDMDDKVFDRAALEKQAGAIENSADFSAFLYQLVALCARCKPDIEHRMLLYIHQHYDKSISLQAMAAHMRLSQGYVSRVFRERTGESFVRYLTRVRMEHARQLLAGTSEPITQIALKTGYDSPSYFTSVFGKTVGMSPAEYRKKERRI